MPGRVFVTGMGIISAIGDNVSGNLNALLNKDHGVGYPKQLKTYYSKEIPVAEIDLSNEELLKRSGFSPEIGHTRTTLLGIIAAKEAAEQARLDPTAFKTGLISATTIGGMDKTEVVYVDFLKDRENTDYEEFIKTHENGDSTENIAEVLGIDGFMTTISTACSSSANAIMLGARMIKSGRLDCAVVGGVDSMTKFTLNGFNTLMILDREHCKPFDENRVGLNLGEAGAFLVLESEEMIKKTGNKALAIVNGYANTNDAFHQTASSPQGDGAFMAMEQALKVAGLSTTDISYVNVHGTGTDNNDLSEGRAMRRLFGDEVPLFSSTKPYTGHTLGAAGSVEAIYSILAINNDIVFPSLNIKNPIAEFPFSAQTELLENVEVNHVLSNSFGFGGNNTSLIFSKA